MIGGGSCGLCLRPRTVFYCELCVRRGDFVSSTSPYPDRFSDKRLKLLQLESRRRAVEERCRVALLGRVRRDEMAVERDRRAERIRLLRLAVQQKCERIKSQNARLNSAKELNGRLRQKLPIYRSNVDTVRKYSQGKEKEIQNRGRFLDEERNALHALRTLRLRQLNDYIFPITELSSQSQSAEVESRTERALAEALRPVRNSQSGAVPPPLQILSAALPFDGDYGAYRNWADKGPAGPTGGPANAEPVGHNPAHRLGAALAYAAQMIRIVAFYLDVRPPCGVAYGDFCSAELDERKFKRSILKLQSCAALIIGELETDREQRRRLTLEPPLHALLRLCPARPRRDYGEDDAECVISEIDIRERTDGDSWWGKVDGEFLSMQTMTSDEEEPEPPEHLHWDAEAPEPEMTTSTAKRGMMTNAAASIVSIWRVFTKN